MTFDELNVNIANGAYEPHYENPPAALSLTHVEDETKSVIWNREFVRARNAKRALVQAQNRENENEVYRRFTEDLITAAMNEYGMSRKEASVVASKAYEEGHSAGYGEVLSCAQDLCGFWEDMCNA